MDADADADAETENRQSLEARVSTSVLARVEALEQIAGQVPPTLLAQYDATKALFDAELPNEDFDAFLRPEPRKTIQSARHDYDRRLASIRTLSKTSWKLTEEDLLEHFNDRVPSLRFIHALQHLEKTGATWDEAVALISEARERRCNTGGRSGVGRHEDFAPIDVKEAIRKYEEIQKRTNTDALSVTSPNKGSQPAMASEAVLIPNVTTRASKRKALEPAHQDTKPKKRPRAKAAGLTAAQTQRYERMTTPLSSPHSRRGAEKSVLDSPPSQLPLPRPPSSADTIHCRSFSPPATLSTSLPHDASHTREGSTAPTIQDQAYSETDYVPGGLSCTRSEDVQEVSTAENNTMDKFQHSMSPEQARGVGSVQTAEMDDNYESSFGGLDTSLELQGQCVSTAVSIEGKGFDIITPPPSTVSDEMAMEGAELTTLQTSLSTTTSTTRQKETQAPPPRDQIVPTNDLPGALTSLQPTKWLSTTAVELILNIIHQDEYRFIDPAKAGATNPQLTLTKIRPDDKSLIVPFNVHNNHWVFAVLRLEEGDIQYFDTLHPWHKHKDEEDARDILINFARTLKHCVIPCGRLQWKFHANYRLNQTNTYDCGILMLVMIFFTVIGHPLPNQVDCAIWRFLFDRALVGDADSSDDSQTMQRYLEPAHPFLYSCMDRDCMKQNRVSSSPSLETRRFSGVLETQIKDTESALMKIAELRTRLTDLDPLFKQYLCSKQASVANLAAEEELCKHVLDQQAALLDGIRTVDAAKHLDVVRTHMKAAVSELEFRFGQTSRHRAEEEARLASLNAMQLARRKVQERVKWAEDGKKSTLQSLVHGLDDINRSDKEKVERRENMLSDLRMKYDL